MHTLIHRAFKEGKQTSTSYRKVAVWEESIEDKRITRPQDLVGMETKENNAHTRFMKEWRWGSNGLQSTGKNAEKVYPNLKLQQEVLGRGLNKEILGRRNATTCEHGETVWRINGTGYTLNEVLDSTKAYQKKEETKVQKDLTGELRRRLAHRFRAELNRRWNEAVGDERHFDIPDVTTQKSYPFPKNTRRSPEEWREKQIEFLLREWDGSSIWNEQEGNAATWELKGVTILPPEVFQSYLGRLSALPLQYEFRTMDPRVRPTRNEYEFYVFLRFGIIPEILRKDDLRRRRCGKTPGNPVVGVFHMNNCSRAGGMAKRHNCLLHRVEEMFQEAGITTSFDKRRQLQGSTLRPGDIIAKRISSAIRQYIKKQYQTTDQQENADHNNTPPDVQGEGSDNRDDDRHQDLCDIAIDGTVVSATKGLTQEGYTDTAFRENPKSRRYCIGIPAKVAERAKYRGPNGWRKNVDPVPSDNSMSYGEYLDTVQHMVFVPMAFESAGGVGKTFFPVLRMVSEIYDRENKYAQAQFRIKWRRTIGMALHKSVASRYIASLDEHMNVTGKCYAPLNDVGYDRQVSAVHH